MGLPVLRLVPFVCMPSPIPRQDRWAGSLVLSHRLRPSLDRRRVGSCITGFGACTAFTLVTACKLAKSPKKRPSTPEASAASLPPLLLRLLPGGANQFPGGILTHCEPAPFHGARRSSVRLFGKGRKERYCPLWPQTATVLRAFCDQRKLDLRSESRVFLNHRGQPLTRFGIRHILARCLGVACGSVPNLRKKRLHPHSVRHSTAVALLKSGVDLSSISHMLGHASPTTTNRYAKIDLEMKRQAIARVKPVPRKSRTPWSKDRTILDWLESL
jgi:hypothetical protein